MRTLRSWSERTYDWALYIYCLVDVTVYKAITIITQRIRARKGLK